LVETSAQGFPGVGFRHRTGSGLALGGAWAAQPWQIQARVATVITTCVGLVESVPYRSATDPSPIRRSLAAHVRK
jgi:hypothetical protein